MSKNIDKEFTESELIFDELESIVEETMPEEKTLMALARVNSSIDAEELRQLVIKHSHCLDEKVARELNALVLNAPFQTYKYRIGVLGGMSYDAKRKLSRQLGTFSVSALKFVTIEPMIFEFLLREAFEVRNLVKVETRKNQQTTRNERVWGQNKASGENPSNLSGESKLEDLNGQRFDISNLDSYYEIIKKMDTGEFDENEIDNLSYLKFLLQDFVLSGGSDLHLQAAKSGGRIRYRFQGTPYNRFSRIPLYRYRVIVNGLCSLAGKDASRMTRNSVKSVIKLTILLEGEIKDVEFRFQSLPTDHAPSIILRGQPKPLTDINQVGFLSEQRLDVNKAINSRHGVVAITGPTGSGKTNTLNTFFSELERPDDRVIIELGSPIEIESERRIQITIPDVDDEKKQDLVYQARFKDCLRSDPDVIAFTEIRSRDEAKITFRAATTGHLVFTTLHAADVEETLATILNWQIDRHIVGKGILAIVAQTLVKKLCDLCKVIDDDSSELAGFTIYKRKETGCDGCDNGISGRTAIAEVLYFTDEIRKMIFEGFQPSEIVKSAIEKGLMIPMKRVALRKLNEGVISNSEVIQLVELRTEQNSDVEDIFIGDDEEFDSLPIQEAEYVDVQTVA